MYIHNNATAKFCLATYAALLTYIDMGRNKLHQHVTRI